MTLDEKAVELAARAMCAPFNPDEQIYLGGYMKRWESHRESAQLAITAYLQALRPGSTGEAEEWRDIASAPEGKWVLTCRAGEHGINLCVLHDDEWCDQSGRSTVTHHSMATPTHWMPCPKPPSAMLAAAGGCDE